MANFVFMPFLGREKSIIFSSLYTGDNSDLYTLDAILVWKVKKVIHTIICAG